MAKKNKNLDEINMYYVDEDEKDVVIEEKEEQTVTETPSFETVTSTNVNGEIIAYTSTNINGEIITYTNNYSGTNVNYKKDTQKLYLESRKSTKSKKYLR